MMQSVRLATLAAVFGIAIVAIASDLLSAGKADDPSGLIFTVRDNHGHLITDLRSEEVSVRTRGRKIPVASFSRRTGPVLLGVLLDNSVSSAGKPVPLWRGLSPDAFGKLVEPGDTAVIAAFSQGSLVASHTISTGEGLSSAMKAATELRSGGLGPLNDGIIWLLKSKMADPGSRKVLIIISEFGTDPSEAGARSVIGLANSMGVTIYTILMKADVFHNRDWGLNRSARVSDIYPQETGGRHLGMLSSGSTEEQLAEVAQELRSEYQLSLSEAHTTDVRIEVTRPGTKVALRRGHFEVQGQIRQQ